MGFWGSIAGLAENNFGERLGLGVVLEVLEDLRVLAQGLQHLLEPLSVLEALSCLDSWA